ncbi:hypothetical protein EUX98_g6213 [Antrodiella citrinella]|uniref:Major facilitator superfamily (MFS) profile domain-containing protein n=1 Tax=Antrodiella citrinella TaxID=2447956 RepID=A0A4S4MPJ6_9APHY|nr:hypothetical protein EUX98_g6213 [Antrodiella citrinella]
MVVTTLASAMSAFLLWGFADTLPRVFAFAIIFGGLSGGFSSAAFAASSESVGPNHEQATIAVSSITSVKGVAAIVGPVLSDILLGAGSSDVDILSHFTALDELIQLIYQGAHKFVVLSAVDDDKWTVHVSQSNSEGRWWVGTWSEKDIRKFVGQKSSSIVLESFADRLAQTFVQGDLQIGDWSSEKGADINLTLGPAAKTPIRIPLSELSPEDAASYATKVFAEIALQAQSRRSRLYSSGIPDLTLTHSHILVASTSSSPKRKAEAEPDTSKPKAKKKHHEPEVDAQAKDKIKELEAELAAQKKIATNAVNAAKNSTDGLVSKAKNNTTATARPKGASLANPNRKARKYQALEFESDDD